MKAFYREWGRCWLLITWGRYPEPLHPDEYAADDTYPAHIECPEAHMGNVISPVGAQSFQPYDEVGGESGWSQAIEVPRWADAETGQYVDAAIGRAKNWVDQSRDGS